MSEEPKPIDVETTSQAIAIRETGGTLARALPQQESFESLMVLAKELCTTGFLPIAVKTPAQAVAIILTGRELGLGVMQSLRSISIIQGKPELAADLQLSIFHRDGGRSKWLLLTEHEAKLWLRHPNGDEHTEIFTMEDAKRAGLANGMNWQKYPKAMLRSRAITAGIKSVGFEPLAGAYAPGEIGGPEIVGPEPETVDPNQTSQNSGNVKASYSRPTSQNAPGSFGAATPPVTGGTPFQRNAAPKAQESAPSQPETHPFATAESLEKMIATLQAGQGQPSREIVTKYFREIAQLLPNEEVEDLMLQSVPATKGQMRLLCERIGDFANGGKAVRAFPPNEEPPKAKGAKAKPIEVPRDPPGEPPTEEEKDLWFMQVIAPIPRKGQKRDEYLKNPDTIGSLWAQRHGTDDEAAAARQRLFGFVSYFEPKGWTKKDGTEMPPSKADIDFKKALDAFSEWFEQEHPEEKL